MENNKVFSTDTEKSQQCWPLSCRLSVNPVSVGRWSMPQWQLDGFNLRPHPLDLNVVPLNLFKDERGEYRFNLSSTRPKLFVVLDSDGLTETSEGIHQGLRAPVVCVTAAQNVAASYMDGDYVVLSDEMPLPVQAWIEAFIGRHGELLDVRRKKRKGAGRASG